MRVVVDPNCRIPYITYILQGFTDLGHDITFRRLECPHGFGAGMLIGDAKVWVDTNDMTTVEPGVEQWADVIAKVNADENTPPCVLLGPVFGIRYWSLRNAYATWPRLVRSGARPMPALKGLRFQAMTRLPISAYTATSHSNGDYVYYRGRAWKGKHEGANGPRERFLQALEGVDVERETAITDDRIPLTEYLDKTRRSAVVFNAPAVHGCLGWKLGEYLALGKAIISTSLGGRRLPSPLTHGEHVHFVGDNPVDMRDAVTRLLDDVAYRRRLERGASRWFDSELSPSSVSRRLVWAIER